jgi:hypothetical protein
MSANSTNYIFIGYQKKKLQPGKLLEKKRLMMALYNQDLIIK